MTTTTSTRPDFRDTAVSASIDALAPHAGSGGDPMDAGVSYCLPAPEDKRPAMQSYERQSKIRRSLGIAGLAAVWLIAFKFDVNSLPDSAKYLITAAGVVTLMVPWYVWKSALRGRVHFLREQLAERYQVLAAIARPAEPLVVGTQVAANDGKTTRLSEEPGVIVFDAERRRVLIEGLSHTYAIHARDVLGLRRARDRTHGIEVVYRCGEAPLAITISGAQMGINSQTLYEKAMQTLGPAA